MAQGTFTAKVAGRVKEIKALQLAVFRESAQRTVEVMQTPRAAGGNLRVDTGFLRASLLAGVGDVNFAITLKPEAEGKYAWDAGAVSLVIANADITDRITVVYTANYARPREYGSRGQPGDRFVGLAAQQWARTVAEVSAEATAKTKP